MTSRYTPARAVPPGFPDVLRDFSREVLRNYPRGRNAPADSQAFILEFAARYFANGGKPPAALKIKKQEGRATGAGSSAPGGSSKQQAVAALDDLENRIQQLFRAADRDNSGQLDPREMKAVLHALGSEIGLQQSDVRLLVSLGDTNGDGLISYPEFIPLAVQIISLIAAKAKEAQERGTMKASAMIGAEYALVHGFTSVELQNRLLDAFRLVDQDADGLVSYEELNAALGGSGLGLSRKDINLITSEAMEFDTNGDGRLNFAELAPMVFGLLADNIAKQLEIELTPTEVTAISNLLARECQAFDPSGTGMIPLAAVTSILRDSDLHLSWLQQQAIAAQVNVDPSSGMVDVRSFIERASSLLYALQRVQVDTAFAQRLLEMRSSPVVVVNNGAATTDRPTFDNALLAVLSSLDKGNGKAPVADVRVALSGAAEGSPFPLNDRQIDALVAAGLSTSDEESAREMNAAAASSSASLPLQTLLQVAFDVLHQLQELDLLQEYYGAASGGAEGAAAGGAGGR